MQKISMYEKMSKKDWAKAVELAGAIARKEGARDPGDMASYLLEHALRLSRTFQVNADAKEVAGVIYTMLSSGRMNYFARQKSLKNQPLKSFAPLFEERYGSEASPKDELLDIQKQLALLPAVYGFVWQASQEGYDHKVITSWLGVRPKGKFWASYAAFIKGQPFEVVRVSRRPKTPFWGWRKIGDSITTGDWEKQNFGQDSIYKRKKGGKPGRPRENKNGYNGVNQNNGCGYYFRFAKTSNRPRYQSGQYPTAEDAALARDDYILANGLSNELSLTPEQREKVREGHAERLAEYKRSRHKFVPYAKTKSEPKPKPEKKAPRKQKRTEGYIGIYKIERRGLVDYRGQIKVDGVVKYSRLYKNPADAARWYNEMILKHRPGAEINVLPDTFEECLEKAMGDYAKELELMDG